jgi:hypothetical protein
MRNLVGTAKMTSRDLRLDHKMGEKNGIGNGNGSGDAAEVTRCLKQTLKLPLYGTGHR